MKKRHIKIAKKLCEEWQGRPINYHGMRLHLFTTWQNVHPAYKRLFYKIAMEKENARPIPDPQEA